MTAWHIFSRDNKGGAVIATGTNSHGDGPERNIGCIAGFSPEDEKLALAAPELLLLVWQYRRDLEHPVAPDSRERRIAAIDAVLAKIES